MKRIKLNYIMDLAFIAQFVLVGYSGLLSFVGGMAQIPFLEVNPCAAWDFDSGLLYCPYCTPLEMDGVCHKKIFHKREGNESWQNYQG